MFLIQISVRKESFFQLNTFLLLSSIWDKLEFFSQISINEPLIR